MICRGCGAALLEARPMAVSKTVLHLRLSRIRVRVVDSVLVVDGLCSRCGKSAHLRDPQAAMVARVQAVLASQEMVA